MRTPTSRLEKLAGFTLFLAFVTLSALFFYPGFLSGRFHDYQELRIRTADGLGLTPGDRVITKGIQVGEVVDLALDDSNQVLITCGIYARHRRLLQEGTRALLIPPALVGSPQVRLLPGNGAALASGTILEATVEASPLERVSKLADTAGHTFERVEERIEQLGNVLASMEKTVEAINSGEGSLGKLVYEPELYQRSRDLVVNLSKLASRLDTSIDGFDGLRQRLDRFAQLLLELKDDLRESSTKLRSSLVQLEKGMERFPEAVSRTVSTLREGRKVVESLKRSFLVSPNLPRDPEEETLAPASFREAPNF